LTGHRASDVLQMLLVFLTICLFASSALAGFGSIFSWERCPINSTTLNQLIIRDRLQASNLTRSPPVLGILEQHLALDAAPYLIARSFHLVFSFSGHPSV
jgi:hypothetical protein